MGSTSAETSRPPFVMMELGPKNVVVTLLVIMIIEMYLVKTNYVALQVLELKKS